MNEDLMKFLDKDNKIKALPSKYEKRKLVLNYLVSLLENKEYNEKEINEFIKKNIVFEDYVLVRRELIDYKFLVRSKDGKIYYKGEKV